MDELWISYQLNFELNKNELIMNMEWTETLCKNGVLQLALQFNFWVALDTCNSLYLYAMNVNRQTAQVG
jgi:hypothetical protein